MRALVLGLLCASAAAQVANPNVVEENIHGTICTPGWTALVRPPDSEMAAVKRRLMEEAQVPYSHRGEYELDHVMPLEVGGHPRDPANLRLQPYPEAHEKDLVEDRVKREICAGKRTLASGRACFVTGWRTC